MRTVAKPHVRSIRTNPPRATQPATTPSPVHTTGPQGTPGGKAMPSRKPGTAKGQPAKLGPQVYLWILIGVELILIGGLRKFFRRFHGG